MKTFSTSVFGMLIGAGLYASTQDRSVADAFFKSDNTKYDQSIEDLMSLTSSLLFAISMAFIIKMVCHAYQKYEFFKELNNGFRDFCDVPDHFKENKEVVLENKDVVLAAVAENGWALIYASEELRGDRDVVLAAVAEFVEVFEYASYELRSNRAFVLSVVAQDGSALAYASEALRGDREVVLVAVAQDGCSLASAQEELRGDRGVVLAAIAQNGYALEHAAEELRANKEVVLAALAENGWAFKYASEELRANREFVLAAVAANRGAYQYASGELKDDPTFSSQMDYIRQQDDMTRTKLLTLYTKLLQINLEKTEQRLALSKLLSDRLEAESSFTDNVTVIEDLLEEIVKKPPLDHLSFEECIGLFRQHKPEGIDSDTTIETLIEEVNAFRL